MMALNTIMSQEVEIGIITAMLYLRTSRGTIIMTSVDNEIYKEIDEHGYFVLLPEKWEKFIGF